MKKQLAAVAGLLLASASAHAALLNGQTVQETWVYADLLSNIGSDTAVAGAGVEFSNFLSDGVTSIDFSDTNIRFGFLYNGGSFSTASFNGFETFDLNSTIPDFTSVSINAATNMAGLDASRISFDANHIWVNFQGLSFGTSTVVSLDINTAASAVPEPSTLALLSLGMAAWRLRRRAAV